MDKESQSPQSKKNSLRLTQFLFRHFFGVNTSIKGGLFLADEDKSLIYPAGHNVVLYKLDDKE